MISEIQCLETHNAFGLFTRTEKSKKTMWYYSSKERTSHNTLIAKKCYFSDLGD